MRLWGRFTAKGTSIDGHYFIIQDIQKQYEEKIELIEKSWLDYSSDAIGYKFRGDPLTIVFDKNIEDLSMFLDELLASRKNAI